MRVQAGIAGQARAAYQRKEIGESIIAETGGFVDVAIVTHEHQDHVNGLTPENFPGLKVGTVWFAWTENPMDDVANQLRKKFKDRLLGLIDTRANLLAPGRLRRPTISPGFSNSSWAKMRGFQWHAPSCGRGKGPGKSVNKVAMKFLRNCAAATRTTSTRTGNCARFRARDARAFVLGPPRDVDKIDDLDPVGDENFGDDGGRGMGVGCPDEWKRRRKASPFPRRHALSLDQALDLPHSASS